MADHSRSMRSGKANMQTIKQSQSIFTGNRLSVARSSVFSRLSGRRSHPYKRQAVRTSEMVYRRDTDNSNAVYFPPVDGVDLKALKINEEGKYSISRPDQAQAITELICTKTRDLGLDPASLDIVDATAGWGGNTVNFQRTFKHVYAIERDAEHFEALQCNIEAYGVGEDITLTMGDCLESLRDGTATGRIVFADPPWSQPGRQWDKSAPEWHLFLSERSLSEDVSDIMSLRAVDLLVLKVPANFAIDAFTHALPEIYDVQVNSLHTYKILMVFWSQNNFSY